MDMNIPAGDATPEVLLRATEELYREIAEELILAVRKVRAGETAEARTAMQAVKDLRAAFQMVMDERTRVDKLRKQVAGAVHDGALDFDAARVEIGRRLACLRDAAGGG
ncbi:hypothetical protein [Rhodobacter ferrooxidans]|uniref:Uncharacterized protein n=1 Tax=Rhodobacter ferrooxidans TaxID=371731 RepID=C8S4K1_9RHOB|nr:hypothetical protein [Rhodobacter sp. SW2]EEW24084.1 hypothetical protein Rsw2DRAFT_2979 [Rhodobacter sp. SW2]